MTNQLGVNWKHSGLTMIEITIAMVLLSVGVLAALGPLLLFSHASADAAARTAAIQLAQAKMEECTAAGFQEAVNGINEDKITLNKFEYNRTMQIISDGKLAHINVTISWADARQLRAVEFSTTIANLGG